ncbi:MAG: zf-HC2 domain-containing protein [Candidatus Spyradocola sp.]|jgi:hypothetical protein
MAEKAEKRETLCAVAQDLMPLVLDKVCSEESSQFVEEHVQSCGECREVWTRMQAEEKAPQAQAEPEKSAQNRDIWKGMRRYMRRFTVRGILLGLAGALVLLVLVAFGVDRLWLQMDTPIPLDEYDMHLTRTEDGWVAGVFESGPYCGVRRFSLDDEKVLSMTYTTSVIPKRDRPETWVEPDYYLSGGTLYTAAIEVSAQDGAHIVLRDEIREIRLVSSEGVRVIYRAGEEIPLCDEETDAKIRSYLQQSAFVEDEIPWGEMEVQMAEPEKNS